MHTRAGRIRGPFTLLTTSITLSLFTGIATAATTYRAIDLTPPSATSALAFAAGGGKQVGNVDDSEAALWSATNTAVNLAPTGHAAVAHAADATSQGGVVDNHAALWYGSAASFVDLHPSAAYNSSTVLGIGNGQQVGTATDLTNHEHAALWSGAANTFVDLHPTSGIYTTSTATGTNGVQQVGTGYIGEFGAGRVYERALLWSGSARSVTELHPAGYTDSQANAIAGDVKVGSGSGPFDAPEHALLWSGPDNRLTDLHPAWATSSAIFATTGTQHAGDVTTAAGQSHAAVWLGSTPADAVDLHAALPASYTYSVAWGIDTNGDVVGWALDGSSLHAILWTPVTPEPAALSLLAFTTLPLLRRPRRHPLQPRPARHPG